MIGEMNHMLGYKNVMEDPFNPRVVPYVEKNLIDLDDPTNSEANSADRKEVYSNIGLLKKCVAEESYG